jgi:prophage regulatory protein
MQATQTPVAEPARLLGVQQVADLLGVSARHVYRLSDGGKMPRPIKLGGSVRWSSTEIERWISLGCPAVVEQRGGRR